MIALVDFTCTRIDSHSGDSLIRFQEKILKFLDLETVIVVPKSDLFTPSYPMLTIHTPYAKILAGKRDQLSILGFIRSIFITGFENFRVLRREDCQGLAFPQIDPGSLVSILILAKIYKKKKFFIRYIGWAEFWAPNSQKVLPYLAKELKKMENISLASETKALSNFLEVSTIEVPYPIEIIQQSGRVLNYLLMIGSPRLEKGYDKLTTIAQQLKESGSKTVLLVQETLSLDGRYKAIQNELRAFDNVQILPPFIARPQLNRYIDESFGVLLPYSKSSYRLRGSAALYEAIERSKIVFAFAWCGFEDQIIDFNLGAVLSNEFDLAPTLRGYKRLNTPMHHFSEFASYTRNQLSLWLK